MSVATRRPDSAAFYPVEQAAPWRARHLLAEKTGKFSPENLRDKMPRRGFIPLSRVPLSLQPPHFVAVAGYAALPIGRMTQENPSLDFLGYCRSRGLLHVTKTRLHALFVYWQERIKHACKKKSFRGFFLDCRSQGVLHVANPPSVACHCLARNKSVP